MKNIFTLLFIALMHSAFSQNNGTLHFYDEFENNQNNWEIKKDKNDKTTIENGHYVLKHTNDNTGMYFNLKVPEIDFKTQNFTIEAKIKQTKGGTDNGFGLRYCIYSDYSNYRNFYVASNGNYKMNHYYSEKDHKIKDWTLDKELVEKSGEYNVFRVEREANIIRYYLNDQIVGYNTNNKYFTSDFGFYISGDIEIEVDYLKVWTSPLKINYVDNPLEDVEVENLGENVNSNKTDKSPVISPDGETLYYVREMSEGNSDIYFSELQSDGTWSKGQSMGKPLNNPSNNSIVVAFPDGNNLLIMNTYNSDGSSKGGGVSLAKRNENGWELPENIEIDDYHNNSKYAGYTISPSGKVMISSAERTETVGERDLYVSFVKDNGEWTKPIGMGTTINTIADEDTPFLAADNKTLYFSSDGHPGVGNADVFVTRRLDDTWTNWSEPENLGKGINTTSYEFGFKISAKGEYAYLYKDVNGEGFGESDLYRVKLSESAKPDPIVFVKGKVFDSETKKPLAAEIMYEDLQNDVELGVANSEPSEGKYKIALPYGKVYGFLAKKEGYYSISQNIDLSEIDELKTVTQDLYLTPIKKGVGIRLNNIFFENNKSELQEISFTELDRLVELLKEHDSWNIEIGGHTDNVGSDVYNKTLSESRALAVKDYIIGKGISTERLSSKGYGEEVPVATNETEEGKAENRRVEFTIL